MNAIGSLSRLLAIALPLVCNSAFAAKKVVPPPTWPAAEWGRAGLSEGVRKELTVIANLNPEDDLQAAINASPDSGGVIHLANGDYVLTTTLNLRSNVVLRGTDRVRTRLVIQMRSLRPENSIVEETDAWAVGVHMKGVERSGLEELTVIFDPSLPPPPKPGRDKDVYKDNPGELNDLHVVSVSLNDSRESWVTNCLILNAGTHPLIIADSQNILIEDLIIEGAFNRGNGSGESSLIRSEHVLFKEVRMADINSFVVTGGDSARDCRFNVIKESRFENDVRFHGSGTVNNLLENSVIALDKWMDRTPLSPGNVNAREAPPGPGNLVYFCTITRDFGAGQRAFSMADNPGMIYEVIQTRARDRARSIA